MTLEKALEFEKLDETNSTVINWEGIELRTTQDPYINGDQYKAEALDKFGHPYTIYWEITNHETTDESEACDWDNPAEVISERS